MDGKIGVGVLTARSAGTDAFCQLQFAGGKVIKTKVKTVYGNSRASINPVFNYELWYPISMPTMTQVQDCSFPARLFILADLFIVVDYQVFGLGLRHGGQRAYRTNC
jgi:hypothetical protein